MGTSVTIENSKTAHWGIADSYLLLTKDGFAFLTEDGKYIVKE